jgi:hypothetical protein
MFLLVHLSSRAKMHGLKVWFPRDGTLRPMKGCLVRVLLSLISLLLVLSAASSPAETKSVETEVRATLAQFITAFDNLDWEAFRSAFDDDATDFYPRGVPERANDARNSRGLSELFLSKFAKVKPRLRLWTSNPGT